MISTFFVLSPRGDTIIAKQYRNDRGDAGAHERSHTEAFFRKIKFWDDRHTSPGDGGENASGAADEVEAESKATGDAPPVFIMPDGLSYLHVKRNGLIFGCATARNVSGVTVIEVRAIKYSHGLCAPNFRIPVGLQKLLFFLSARHRLTAFSTD